MAVEFVREDGLERTVTHRELREAVERRRRALVRPASAAEDRGRRASRTRSRPWSPFLATASLGAIWSSCSPDFGARAVHDRFARSGPPCWCRRLLLQRQGLRHPART
ncbi:hypothetical protein HBB16_14055 [Pseudonocardia sp. MCCB 268]|nr:hypothetical protein [Pseudonocardia cytotoxica]